MASTTMRGDLASAWSKAALTTLAAALAVALLTAQASPCAGACIAGRGPLSGSGTGTARLEGSGAFYVRGSGTLTVRDPGDGAQIEVHGFAFSKKLACGFRIYRGSGWARVSGSDAMIKLDGRVDAICASGGGTCYLLGDGRYRVGARVRPWKERGVCLRFNLTA